MTKRQAWYLYYNSPEFIYHWEYPETNSGLLLCTCIKCGEKQTRETYQTFTSDYVTLIQDYQITAIAQHKCGQWYRVCN